MNRDKTIIAVLTLLLLASLVANGVLWTRARRDSAAAPADGPAPAARTSAPRERGASSAYEIVANPELKGRLGRIVLTFADTGESLQSTRTAIYQPGKDSAAKVSYGPVTAEVLPGEYDLEVSGRKLKGVPVEAGKDTRIPSGVLRLHGADGTRFAIFEPGATDDSLYVDYGNGAKGLPAGEYEVEVNGVREKVLIEAGKVTEF